MRIPLSDKDEYDFYYKEFGTGLGAELILMNMVQE